MPMTKADRLRNQLRMAMIFNDELRAIKRRAAAVLNQAEVAFSYAEKDLVDSDSQIAKLCAEIGGMDGGEEE